MTTEAPRRSSGLAAFLAGLLSALLVAGSVLLWQPRDETVTVLIATPASGTITVAISGAVMRPGLYQLAAGSRLTDLLERAGGATTEAEPDLPSRALLLRDEMHIHLATRPPPMAAIATALPPTATPWPILPPPTSAMTGRPVPSRYDESDQSIDPTATPIGSPEVVRPPGATAIMPGAATPDQRPPLNLNSATAAELERLPGIGPALAARIVADRQRHGPYRRLEELDRVSGIGPTLLVRLRPLVTV